MEIYENIWKRAGEFTNYPFPYEKGDSRKVFVEIYSSFSLNEKNSLKK